MSNRLRNFFLGSLGLVIFAMSWLIYRSYETDQEPVKITEPTIKKNDGEKVAVVEKTAKETKSEKVAKSETPKAAPAPKESVSLKDKKSEKKGDWITPAETIYLDQAPQQKKILDYLKHMEGLAFMPKYEPTFIGVNDQGFDQYEYDFQDGSVKGNVSQWKRSGEVVVEQIEYEGGDKMVRRAPEQDRPFTEISYESKAGDYYHSVHYRMNGTVESIQDTQGKTTTIYYYDEQGRLVDVYTYTEK